jgi:hypothetical protein
MIAKVHNFAQNGSYIQGRTPSKIRPPYLATCFSMRFPRCNLDATAENYFFLGKKKKKKISIAILLV